MKKTACWPQKTKRNKKITVPLLIDLLKDSFYQDKNILSTNYQKYKQKKAHNRFS
jgi:hypothetical protein